MDHHVVRRRTVASAVHLAAMAVMVAGTAWPLAAQKAPRQAAAAPAQPAQTTKGEQAIVVLVNDEPVTAYEIQQRANFLALYSGGGGQDLRAKAEARWAQIVKDPKTNERLQALFREKNVRSREEALAVQKQYVQTLQKNMIEQLKREAHAATMPKLKKEAQEELIAERLQLQEAKRIGIEVPEDEVKRVVNGIAERNKMTEAQFAQHLKGANVDISTMRNRFRAQFAWREVVRRRFGAQVSITQRDIERMISASALEAGEDSVELQVHKLTLPIASRTDQAALARRYAEADALRGKFGGCKTLPALAKEASETRYEDLKYIRPSSIAEPTRSLLLSAKDGDMLPPVTAAGGIEVYTVCGRRPIKADEKTRERAEGDLMQKEFEIVAKRHLRDLRQDAHIEFR
jgi:peptidyl-prolyl cis-trans isomerase SurA